MGDIDVNMRCAPLPTPAHTAPTPLPHNLFASQRAGGTFPHYHTTTPTITAACDVYCYTG